MYTLWLPEVPEGYFRFSDSPRHRFLGITSANGQWTAVTHKPAFFRDVPLSQSYSVPIQDKTLLKIEYEDQTYFLFSEWISRENIVFHNYAVNSNVEIRIGRQRNNDISCQNPYVSESHASMIRVNRQWQIRDCGSVYGTYVNGVRITNSVIKTGDMIYIMGLRIIVGPDFLAVTDNFEDVVVNKNKLQNFSGLPIGYSRYSNQSLGEQEVTYFNRLPRKRLDAKQNVITVEGPPMPMGQKRMPLMLRMGSSLVIGGTAALAGNFTTLLSSVLFPFLSTRYSEDQMREYEKLRLTKYREYLKSKRKEIEDACVEERHLLNRKYPEIQSILELVHQSEHLWERRPGDNDFLHIRLGTGAQQLTTTIDYPPRRFDLETDVLEEEMYQLVEAERPVDNVPIVLSLAETKVCSLLGAKQQLMDSLRCLVMQIAALHSYDEVKCLFFLSEEDLSLWNGIRYLPHAWDDQRTIRFLATNEADAYRLGEYIKNQIALEESDSRNLKQVLAKRPYYIFFALDKKIFESHETLKMILQSDDIQGVSIVTAYNELPKESQKIITLDPAGRNVSTTMGSDGGEDTYFRTDPYDHQKFAKAMRVLANTNLKTAAQEYEMPKLVTFLEMFRCGRIEQLNILKRWKENNPVKSLAAPVGIGADGSLFNLDLHEKRQGPHGLVAGMTGSGKSEFIISYILSMAVNYHPDEVAFVLIDYKGGGLTGAFENPQTGVRLPHLVGTITNLDGASIQRSLMSIESELLRRQRIFNEVKSIVNAGTMDIYSYQKLYRAEKVSEPMPHLFIISDEFAELKQQQPEFMANLVSAARIGRSLGIHLILATQKPTGVVDDQIRSNTKFRVCLRVQERSDSMDMLKRPEAAELTDTGRFYLQVGYNEYFALGQSAWAGAAYEPQEIPAVRRDDAVEFLDTTGQVIAKAAPKAKKTSSEKKQVVAVVEYLSELAKAQNITPRQLWQPALPKLLDLEEMQRQHLVDDPMTVCLGLLDDPENICQPAYRLNFRSCGNMLITGDMGSGKTTMIQNILYSLLKQLSPEDFNFYILDYSSRMMRLFRSLPNCGAVLMEEDGGCLDEFFKLISSLVSERKKLFSELEVDSFEEASSISKIPLILVVIDNLAGMAMSKEGETHNYRLQGYLKNSATYGIKYIIANSHVNEVPSRARQEITEHICLHMKDRYDYSELLGCKVSYIPPELSGRGLVKYDGRPLEFQSAMICAGKEDRIRTESIKTFVAEQCQFHESAAEARRLKTIDEHAEYEDFARQFAKERIPLGFSLKNRKPVAIPLKQLSALSIYLGNSQATLPMTKNILYSAKREKMELWISLYEKSSFGDNGIAIPQGAQVFPASADGTAMLKKLLLSEITARLEITKSFAAWKAENPNAQLMDDAALFYSFMRQKTSAIMILYENFADFCSHLDDQSEYILLKLFNLTKKLNIYVIGLFGPDDKAEGVEKALYKCFNPDRNVLLLGGRFQKQNLCDLPKEMMEEKQIQFNKGLMHYRKSIYNVLVPCGQIPVMFADPDVDNIFAE